MARLTRVTDGAGDSGSLVQSIEWNEDGTFKQVVGDRPIVGCSMLVGSVTARSYSDQDYWLTTRVTEIMEESEEYVKFRTDNSIYEIFY